MLLAWLVNIWHKWNDAKNVQNNFPASKYNLMLHKMTWSLLLTKEDSKFQIVSEFTPFKQFPLLLNIIALEPTKFSHTYRKDVVCPCFTTLYCQARHQCMKHGQWPCRSLTPLLLTLEATSKFLPARSLMHGEASLLSYIRIYIQNWDMCYLQ